MAMDDTKASDSLLAPVVDIKYCKEQTYMKPHPIYTATSSLRPLYFGPNKS